MNKKTILDKNVHDTSQLTPTLYTFNSLNYHTSCRRYIIYSVSDLGTWDFINCLHRRVKKYLPHTKPGSYKIK